MFIKVLSYVLEMRLYQDKGKGRENENNIVFNVKICNIGTVMSRC